MSYYLLGYEVAKGKDKEFCLFPYILLFIDFDHTVKRTTSLSHNDFVDLDTFCAFWEIEHGHLIVDMTQHISLAWFGLSTPLSTEQPHLGRRNKATFAKRFCAKTELLWQISFFAKLSNELQVFLKIASWERNSSRNEICHRKSFGLIWVCATFSR